MKPRPARIARGEVSRCRMALLLAHIVAQDSIFLDPKQGSKQAAWPAQNKIRRVLPIVLAVSLANMGKSQIQVGAQFVLMGVTTRGATSLSVMSVPRDSTKRLSTTPTPRQIYTSKRDVWRVPRESTATKSSKLTATVAIIVPQDFTAPPRV